MYPPDGTVHYHRLVAADTALNPVELVFDEALAFNHELGAGLSQHEPLLDVHALDRGGLGQSAAGVGVSPGQSAGARRPFNGESGSADDHPEQLHKR